MTSDLRSPSATGTFYPADPAKLSMAVDAALSTDRDALYPQAAPQAILSPHAGYRFSGKLAGAAWRSTTRSTPDTVVILSPSHKHAFKGIALPSQAGFKMPGFETLISDQTCHALVSSGLAHIEDAAHDHEHGIETQLPFLNRLHPQAQIVPLVIGDAALEHITQLVDILAALLSRPLFVLSSDLSHYLPLKAAQRKDRETAHLIEAGDAGKLTPAHACGARGVTGFLASSSGRGLRAQRLFMSNSHTATGDAKRTVGYGAWAFFAPDAQIITAPLRRQLLVCARKSLTIRLRKGVPGNIAAGSFVPALQGLAASFVTLNHGTRLRGCIGSLAAHRSLIEDVCLNAVKSGLEDDRFAPITQAELADLTLKIAVLSPSTPMIFSDEADLVRQLQPGRDGLILADGRHRGTFLPMVWDSLPEPAAFLRALKVKAGLPDDHWSPQITVLRFQAESFAEKTPDDPEQ